MYIAIRKITVITQIQAHTATVNPIVMLTITTILTPITKPIIIVIIIEKVHFHITSTPMPVPIWIIIAIGTNIMVNI